MLSHVSMKLFLVSLALSRPDFVKNVLNRILYEHPNSPYFNSLRCAPVASPSSKSVRLVVDDTDGRRVVCALKFLMGWTKDLRAKKPDAPSSVVMHYV